MNVVLIADQSFALRERSMLRRLEIGLSDEAGRVVHAVPHASLPDDLPTLCSPAVGFNDQGFWFSRPARAGNLLRALAAQIGEPSTPDNGVVDVIHAFGANCWGVAVELARQCAAPLVLEIWRAGLLTLAKRYGAWDEGPDIALSVPSAPMAEFLRGRLPAVDVEVAAWGVHGVPDAPRAHAADPTRPSIGVLASGRRPERLHALIDGLSALASRDPQPLVLFDAAAVRRARLWKRLHAAGDSGIADMVVLVDEMEARRELVLSADMLVIPEGIGRHTSLALEAMAHAMPVLASADPDVGWLTPEAGVGLLEAPDARAWATLLRQTLDEPSASPAKGELGPAYVREHNGVARHVGALTDLYQRLIERRRARAWDGVR